MYVVKRDGRKEDVKFDKITSRINKLCYGLDSRFVDSIKISQKVSVPLGMFGLMGLKLKGEILATIYKRTLWYYCIH